MKKLIALLLAVTVCVFTAVTVFAAPETPQAPDGVWSDYAASGFDGGSGTKDDPYQIANAQQLALLAADINSGVYNLSHNKEYFILTDDIDLSAHRWIPIGTGTTNSSVHAFSGYFDGQNHTISGMYVDESAEQYAAGLFGNLSGYTISNLKVTNAYVATASERDFPDGIGILIGNAAEGYGASINISNCHVSGTIQAGNKTYAGGLVGSNSYGSYENCTADVRIISDYMAGGFVGNDFVGSYKGCIAKGDVDGFFCVGGFAGQFFCQTKAEKCMAFGNVSATNVYVGGFAGYIGYNSDYGFGPCVVVSCAAHGDVKTTFSHNDLKIGGFAGSNIGCTIKNSHAAGKVTVGSELTAGGFIGKNSDGTNTDCSYDSDKNDLKAVDEANSTGEAGTITGAASKVVLHNICTDCYGSCDPADTLTVDVAPTCTEKGSQSYHCTRCDNPVTSFEIDADGHEISAVAEKSATCTEKGWQAHYKCENCGKLFSDSEGTNEITLESIETDMIAHDYQWVIDREATASEAGEKHEECSVCHAKKAPVEIPKATGDTNVFFACGIALCALTVLALAAKKRRIRV